MYKPYQFDEAELRKNLREEATEVKQCFTQFSIHTTAVCAIALGMMFGVADMYSYVVYASIPLIALIMAVERIGIFKYTTANRNYGYELHLNRLGTMIVRETDKDKLDRLKRAKIVEWEEALRAWRILQVALFRSVYRTPESVPDALKLENSPLKSLRWINSFRPDLYKLHRSISDYVDQYQGTDENSRYNEKEYPWFLPRKLTKIGQKADSKTTSTYRAGSFLENILTILFLMQLMLLLPFMRIFGPLLKNFCISDWYVGMEAYDTLSLWVLIALLIIVLFRHARIIRRREILENEMLSIHSCSICWQAVIFTHLSVLDQNEGVDNPFEHYTEKLANRAMALAAEPFKLATMSKAVAHDDGSS